MHRLQAMQRIQPSKINRNRGALIMYYRDSDLNLYKIITETADFYICEGLKGPNAGRIVNFHKRTGKKS